MAGNKLQTTGSRLLAQREFRFQCFCLVSCDQGTLHAAPPPVSTICPLAFMIHSRVKHEVLIEELLKNGAPELITETSEGEVSIDAHTLQAFQGLRRCSGPGFLGFACFCSVCVFSFRGLNAQTFNDSAGFRLGQVQIPVRNFGSAKSKVATLTWCSVSLCLRNSNARTT